MAKTSLPLSGSAYRLRTIPPDAVPSVGQVVRGTGAWEAAALKIWLDRRCNRRPLLHLPQEDGEGWYLSLSPTQWTIRLVVVGALLVPLVEPNQDSDHLLLVWFKLWI